MSEMNVQVNLEGIGAIDELTQKLQEVQTLIEKINKTPLAINLSVGDQSETRPTISGAELVAHNSKILANQAHRAFGIIGKVKTKTIVCVQKSEFPEDDNIYIRIDENNIFESNARGTVMTYEHGEENGWATAKTESVSLMPLTVLK